MKRMIFAAVGIIALAVMVVLLGPVPGQADGGADPIVGVTKNSQQPGSARTNLQRHDLSAPGREVIQVRVDFAPGYVAPRHTHPGEEIIYVLQGTLEYRVEGMPTRTYKAGDVLMVPAGAIHSATNLGSTKGSELATYIVEKGKPLITLVQ